MRRRADGIDVAEHHVTAEAVLTIRTGRSRFTGSSGSERAEVGAGGGLVAHVGHPPAVAVLDEVRHVPFTAMESPLAIVEHRGGGEAVAVAVAIYVAGRAPRRCR